ncbi:MAG TPA: glycerophosphodiester phosphodiesterase [Candidatus Saccharimonadales bacterium]|nr:glycerophosphodiester phosphodiesterase [Candidatus Saccharimonadales bacterium]
MKPLVIAHRGDTINFPENTIAAFKSAFERGADGVELDIQYFRSKLIVVHNYLFDKNISYPELSEVLEAFVSKGRLEIEIKSLDLEFMPKLKQLISKYPTADIEITTSVWPLVSYLRKNFPAINLGIIFLDKEFEDWMTEDFICTKILSMMKLMNANVAHIPWKILVVNPTMIERLHDLKMKIHSHIFKQDINKEKEIYKQMVELEVDQCTIDDIELIGLLRNLK